MGAALAWEWIKLFLCFVKGHKGNEYKDGQKELLAKIMAWCAYQERSHFEVRAKLRQMGAGKTEVEEVLARLIGENFLNEERFSMLYAGGKFRIKQWGRNKIRAGLRLHQVSEPNINKALDSIDGEGYSRAIRLLAQKKSETISTVDRRKKYQATYTYLVQRGFEPELVGDTLTGLMGEPNNYEFRT